MKSATIDGIKVKKKNLVEQIYKANKNVRCLKSMVTHQQVFCHKYLNLSCIITEPVVSMVVVL